MKAKKLIEVALPIKEISAESVRDKSIRHGHISTLHLWWARRPLPVCRAIVFATLVPDPLDDNCPTAFKDAVIKLLGREGNTYDWYKPYDDIPYTAIKDKVEDNLRNRLLMFIGKFSDKCQKNMINGKDTNPKEQLSDGSLIKWENKNNPRILRIARELIWVAYNSEKKPNVGYETLHKDYDSAFNAITQAEDALYSVVDRHIKTSEIVTLEKNLHNAIENFQNQMPSVFDPFAGGGAIPLEAARLGCRSYGNDINPVAHIIERGSAEFPQKYGKPIIYSDEEFISRYGSDGLVMTQDQSRGIIHDSLGYHVPNRLSFDVEFYARLLINKVESDVGDLFPKDENGHKPIAFYWSRTITCSNPSCMATVPMLKQFYLSNTNNKVWMNPIIEGKNIKFEIKHGTCPITVGWNNRGTVTCPCCGCVTDIAEVKRQSNENHLSPIPLVGIYESENGREYKVLSDDDTHKLLSRYPSEYTPQVKMPRNSSGGDTHPWGFTKWGDLFSERQLHIINNFIKKFNELKSTTNTDTDYHYCVLTYLSLWLDRIIVVNSTFGRWNVRGEKIEHMFNRQAIAMISDFPESNPFCSSSGSALNQIEWVIGYIESESKESFDACFCNVSSGDKSQYPDKSLTSVVTDPPYYDAIAYADISDFFYVWLKQTLGDIYPLNFSTPQTPKTEECTALKHHHNGDINMAKKHFESKLTEIFDAIEKQTSDIVSIMFAHQSTEAWTTLCNSILGARMNITGSWPMDTEMVNRSIGLAGAALESSVTVACRPSERNGFGDYKEIKKDIEKKVADEVESLYALGFRGADLITACFGQAVSEFGKYKTVEKSDGSEVSVAELLGMARDAAVNSLLKGVPGDDITRFYTGWLQLNGAGDTDFDDATKFTRVGINVNINDLRQDKILILEGRKMHIAMSEEHLGHSMSLGTNATDSLIDQAHRAIILFREGNRQKLLRFVRDIAPESTSPLWRLLETLKELLPANDDYKQVQGLLQNADDLRQNCNEIVDIKQSELIFE